MKPPSESEQLVKITQQEILDHAGGPINNIREENLLM